MKPWLTQGSGEFHVDGFWGKSDPVQPKRDEGILALCFRAVRPKTRAALIQEILAEAEGDASTKLGNERDEKVPARQRVSVSASNPIFVGCGVDWQRLERWHCRLDRLTRHRSVRTLGPSSASL